MSLQIILDVPKTIVKQPEVTETISEITIDRIVDIPGYLLEEKELNYLKFLATTMIHQTSGPMQM